MKDTFLHQGMRKKLIETLRKKGIQDEKILVAMAELPRHYFIDTAFAKWAYTDKAFPIGNEQTISQPYTVAIQTQLLDVKPKEKVLEIGTGSGYQAGILALLGARVFTIERQEALHLKAKKLLEKLEVGNVRCYFKDGFKGLPEFAPFDKIIVTAGATSPPEKLLEQLKINGKMVIPVGQESQKMLVITRTTETDFESRNHGDFKFVPFLPGVNKSSL